MTERVPVATLTAAGVAVESGKQLLAPLDLVIRAGEHWAVLGPNGSGKTTLLSLLATLRHPSCGRVELLGQQMGRVDVFSLRSRIGHVDRHHEAAERMTAYDVLLSGCTGTRAIMLRWRPTPAQSDRAAELASELHVEALLDRWWPTLSAGERSRLLIARALMPDPALLLLDEAAAGLDLAGREQLVSAVDTLLRRRPTLTTVSVTHHLEELPPSTSHALLLRGGAEVAKGAVVEALTSSTVSSAFGLDVELTRLSSGRWSVGMQVGIRG